MPIKSLVRNYSSKNFTEDKRPQVRWDQTAAQSSILFSPIVASAGRHQTCLPSWRKELSARVYARYVSSDILWGPKVINFDVNFDSASLCKPTCVQLKVCRLSLTYPSLFSSLPGYEKLNRGKMDSALDLLALTQLQRMPTCGDRCIGSDVACNNVSCGNLKCWATYQHQTIITTYRIST